MTEARRFEASRGCAAAAMLVLLAWPRPAETAPGVKAQDEAAAISAVALTRFKSGEFAMCGSLYHEAYKTDPAYLGYLYSAARCEQKAGDLDAAERDYRQFLARAPAEEPLAAKAQANLGEILEARRLAPPAPAAAPAEVRPGEPAPAPGAAAASASSAQPSETIAASASPPGPPVRIGAWLTAGLGAAGAGAGTWLVFAALADRDDLQARLAAGNGGVIVGLTPGEAHAAETSYRTRLLTGGVVAGVGVVAAGVGTWLLLRAPEAAVAATPGPAPLGLGLAWRWR